MKISTSNNFYSIFRDDAPGVDGELTDDSISFWESFLFILDPTNKILFQPFTI